MMTQQRPARTMIAVLIALPAFAYGHGISEAERQRMLEGGYLQYVELGATHMLTGYDHLLFLFGVVFFLSTFKDVAKLVTVFTIGHCMTLIFATFLPSCLSRRSLRLPKMLVRTLFSMGISAERGRATRPEQAKAKRPPAAASRAF